MTRQKASTSLAGERGTAPFPGPHPQNQQQQQNQEQQQNLTKKVVYTEDLTHLTILVGWKRLQTFKVVICHPFRISPATVHSGEPLGSNSIPLTAVPNSS